MAAPDYVPVQPQDRPRRAEQLPPAKRWIADRPGDFADRQAEQPTGPLLGNPGPDLGYALRIAHSMRPRLQLREGEHVDDVEAGCVAIAMKRAALFGRAPVVHDLTFAYNLFGFLDAGAPTSVVADRKGTFQAIAHDYRRQRDLADSIDRATLRKRPDEITAR